tara:strand:- start:137 stop:259 length:123 start_codon:yes stop_codon:yes gene_type:complete
MGIFYAHAFMRSPEEVGKPRGLSTSVRTGFVLRNHPIGLS